MTGPHPATPDPARARSERYGEVWDDYLLSRLLAGPEIDPAAVAVHTDRGSWTYGMLDREAERIARGLWALGVRDRDTIVVQLGNRIEFVTVCVAAFRIGAVPVLAMPSLRAVEIGRLVDATDAGALVIGGLVDGFDHRSLARSLGLRVPVVVAGEPEEFVALSELDGPDRQWLPADPGDVALVLLSGGTTDRPKLIPRTHQDYGFQLRATAQQLGVTRDWTYLAAVPVAHNAALGCPGVLGLLRLGGEVVLSPGPAPHQAFPLIGRHRRRPILTTLMPALLDIWTACSAYLEVDLTGTVVEVGGASMDRGRLAAAEAALGCVVTRWFGMAEGPLSFTRPGQPDRLDHEGRALSVLDEFRITDATHRPVRVGAWGQIEVRGPSTIRSYLGDHPANTTHFDAAGFFRTGDRGLIDAEGNLQVGGRIDDLINRGGEKIAPEDLEPQLRAAIGVDVAVAGRPDPLFGHRVVAFVAADAAGLDVDDVRRMLRERGVAEYKLPDELVVVSSLPRTAIGKIDRAALLAGLDDR
ncbi:AMP-binding protein [Kribbella sp. NPDC050820]|uniref:AMP-binding protein n=1 Tax=Kribbella sp. NPDC050820 TaxID=3155408 RepID=UPI003406F79C